MSVHRRGVWLGVLFAACTPASTPSEPPPPACEQTEAPSLPLRRLTRLELDDTIREGFAVEADALRTLPSESLGNGFSNDAHAIAVSPASIEGHLDLAKRVAAAICDDAKKAQAFVGCDLALEACREPFFERLALRAYRRPADGEDLDALRRIHALGLELEPPFGGLRAVLELVLQSPRFLYRIEEGGPTTDYELATRLAFFLWGQAPDDALLAAASAGSLSDPAGRAAQVQRLLADPRAKGLVRSFHGQLLGFDGLDGLVRNTAFFPEFKPGMGRQLHDELDRFVDHVWWDDRSSVSSFLTSRVAFVDATTASLYGVVAPAAGVVQKVQLP